MWNHFKPVVLKNKLDMAAFIESNTVCAPIQFYIIFHVNSEKNIIFPPFPTGVQDIPFLYSMQKDFGDHPTSCLMGAREVFLRR
jgi:hypothetical protein